MVSSQTESTLLSSEDDSQRTQYPYVTGTSVIGIKYKDGILMAADMGGSYGSTIRYKSVERLKQVGKHSLIGASGEISDFQEITRYLDELILGDNMWDDGNSLGPKEVHNYLTRTMYNRRNKFDPLWNSLVLGGVKNGQKYLGSVSMIGVHFEDDHVATGFGNHLARPILREEWRDDLTFEEGVTLLEKCMRNLLYRDRSAVNKVQIANITEEGLIISQPYSLKTFWNHAAFQNPTAGVVSMIGVHFEDDHVATGFGNHMACPILREEWRENLTFEEGVQLLEKCMRNLLYRDRSAVNKVQIANITEDGLTISQPYSLKTFRNYAAFQDPTYVYHDKRYSVVRFDTKTETFSEMKTFNLNGNTDHCRAFLMIKNGCIHVCITYESYVGMVSFVIEFWKIDEEGNCKKMETYRLDSGYMRFMEPLHLTSNGNLLMRGNKFESFASMGNLYNVDLKKKHGKRKDKETRCSDMEISGIVRYIETSVICSSIEVAGRSNINNSYTFTLKAYKSLFFS
ncbi:20S proteasome beta subunit G1 [Artemisia annua]|uniref:20S proteasome beta subunit G1 n=1 Tax=Artemisia annua TaxID=35608 RepID=A0A2U1PC89_ARTAN|nr:20S proteasome beta subunit G1 [Artemisia annua]